MGRKTGIERIEGVGVRIRAIGFAMRRVRNVERRKMDEDMMSNTPYSKADEAN